MTPFGGTLKRFVFAFFLLTLSLTAARAEDQKEDIMMKAASMGAGKISPSEQKLFEESIRTTKDSIARESLESFYRDALDYYHEKDYASALDLLDRIHAIDPYYQDVGALRESARSLLTHQTHANTRKIVEELMRKGETARAEGKNVPAIAFWNQVLTVDPDYAPAKKKIQDANHALAQKQLEMGYLYYDHSDMSEALDSWMNAIALDPSYKRRGLLVLMSRVELTARKDQIYRLSSQGAGQYDQKDYEGALATYEELLRLEPRNEEARRMASKIRIQLGEAAFKSARAAMNRKLYAEAIRDWEQSIRYGYEIQHSQEAIQEAEHIVQEERAPRPPKPKTPETPAKEAPAVAAAPAQAIDPAEAMEHYRQGLAAIRSKDFHRAVEELDIASQLDSTNEQIYVARQRAHQEWNALSGSSGNPQ